MSIVGSSLSQERPMVRWFFSHFPAIEALRRGEWDFSLGVLP